MLNISKLLVESKKHKFENRDAVIAILSELKDKEKSLDKTEIKTAELQYNWLREMQAARESNIILYQTNKNVEQLIKEKNELKAINQFIPLVLNFLLPNKIEDEITVEILANSNSIKGIRDTVAYFKTKYPTIDKNLISKVAKKVFQR
jgi:glutathionylspermidine synthase